MTFWSVPPHNFEKQSQNIKKTQTFSSFLSFGCVTFSVFTLLYTRRHCSYQIVNFLLFYLVPFVMNGLLYVIQSGDNLFITFDSLFDYPPNILDYVESGEHEGHAPSLNNEILNESFSCERFRFPNPKP